MRRVFIYGAGRVGRCLGRAIEDHGEAHGLSLIGAWNRSFRRAFETSQILDIEVSSGDVLPDALPRADVIILSVTDDAIAETSRALGRHLSPRQCLLHTSGSLASTIMRADETRAALGGCHPLQSIPRDDGDYALLRGATFAVEGDPDAQEAARLIARAAGGEPITIRPEGKVHYHAAAVISANYTTVLADVARVLYEEAGLDARVAVKTLLPLLRGTLQNLEDAVLAAEEGQGAEALASTLTGPVRRGDARTVKRHLKALRKLDRDAPNEGELAALYQILGRRAATLAQRTGLAADQLEAVERALGREADS